MPYVVTWQGWTGPQLYLDRVPGRQESWLDWAQRQGVELDASTHTRGVGVDKATGLGQAEASRLQKLFIQQAGIPCWLADRDRATRFASREEAEQAIARLRCNQRLRIEEVPEPATLADAV